MDRYELHLVVVAEELFPTAGGWEFEMATAGFKMHLKLSLGKPTVTISSMGPRAPGIFKSAAKKGNFNYCR